MESDREFRGFGSVWDWLGETRKPRRPAPPPEPSVEEGEPSHRITDDELLALEREADAAAKMESRRS